MTRGAIFWLHFTGRGSEPSGRRPAVVIQHDRYNGSAISTTIVAAITSNLRLADMPGNVRLAKGEAKLARPSVINVSQVLTIDKSRLTERVGTLTVRKRLELVEALALVFGPDVAAQ